MNGKPVFTVIEGGEDETLTYLKEIIGDIEKGNIKGFAFIGLINNGLGYTGAWNADLEMDPLRAIGSLDDLKQEFSERYRKLCREYEQQYSD